MNTLYEELVSVMDGDVAKDIATRKKYSRDTSLFEETPSLVAYPKDAADVACAVRAVHNAKKGGHDVSITARAAGTDMTGGPLTSSLVLVFTKFMNHVLAVTRDEASAEPGVYYRDFEKETLKHGALLPSFPASRELCAIGGIVANNAGGEMTLRYGKTNKYVRELHVVLSDGSLITTKPLSSLELKEKEKLETLEGAIYREIHALIENNKDGIEAARPRVSKNSAGYALWDVMNTRNDTFDLSQIITGSQGTLGIVTKATFGLITPKEYRSMLVIFLSDLSILPEVVHRVLRFDPEAFESYDDKTFGLAVRFFPQIVAQFGIGKMISLGFAFLPEVGMVLSGGVPKLILMAEFAEDSQQEANKKAADAEAALKGLAIKTHIAGPGIASEKYWIIRHEAFALLRKNVKGLYAAAFIDDLVIPPDAYPVFWPKLTKLLAEYKLLYTIQGHIGDGNLHIIPLVDMKRSETAKTIIELTPRVYKLVVAHGGSITGEHNDGIIRTPYLTLMFGARMTDLFAQVKKIFDPLNILNPGKKVGGTEADIQRLLIRSS
jgi:FAD/FMN-containing dehydrogenase